MRKAEQIAGSKRVKKLEKEIVHDFDPQEYDRHMERAFGEKYYAEEDDRDQLKGEAVEEEK